MKRNRKPSPHTVSGLRMRFFPKSRIGQGLISAAPWVDIVLLLALLVLLEHKFVLQPGCIINLPKMAFADGSRSFLTAVVLSVEGAYAQGREEIVFFDDVRYEVRKEKHLRKLRTAFAEFAKTRPKSDLIIQADKAVTHGTMALLFDMARGVGIERVNLASKQLPLNQEAPSQ